MDTHRLILAVAFILLLGPAVARVVTPHRASSPHKVVSPRAAHAVTSIVIQGQVTALRGTTVELATPVRAAPCLITPPRTPVACPQVLVAGPAFRVNIAHAVFETAYGVVVPRMVAVGDPLVIVGTNQLHRLSPHVYALQAVVIERLAVWCRTLQRLCVAMTTPAH